MDEQIRPNDAPSGDAPRDVGLVVTAAYDETVDVETAARHLYAIHKAARPPMTRPVGAARRGVVALLSAFALVVSSGVTVAASARALPGEVLYPVKRGVEQVTLIVSVSTASDARLHLKMARARLAEAQGVLGSRPAVIPDLIREALDATKHAERIGGERVAPQVAEVWSETEMTIAAVSAALDAEAVARLDAVVAAARLLPSTGEEEAVVMGTDDAVTTPGRAIEATTADAADGVQDESAVEESGEGPVDEPVTGPVDEGETDAGVRDRADPTREDWREDSTREPDAKAGKMPPVSQLRPMLPRRERAAGSPDTEGGAEPAEAAGGSADEGGQPSRQSGKAWPQLSSRSMPFDRS